MLSKRAMREILETYFVASDKAIEAAIDELYDAMQRKSNKQWQVARNVGR